MVKRAQTNRKKLFFILGLAALSLAGGALAYALVSGIPDPERISARVVVESTKIYDRTGKVLLYEIHGEEKRTVIPLEDIPEKMRLATIAAEDDTFYKHIGLDGFGIVRAFLKNLAKGGIYQGGSTITQQLVKNALLERERTTGQKLTRKLKEVILAILVERKFSKDEILELYLNQIPYGANAYGVESASQTYFAKEAKDLTLAEAATLASLPRAPTYYFNRRDELTARKDWVLDRMAELQFIAKEEAAKAKREGVLFSPLKQNIRAPHFVFLVREYLNEKYGEEFVESGGLTVITTLDWELQEKAEAVIKEGAEQNEKLVEASNAALVSLDPRTGEILAMVGSRDYWGEPLPEGCTPGLNCRFDPQLNVALRARQPGSAFKPFVYATALKKGYLPETVLFDVPTEFNANCNPDGTPGPGIKAEDCYHPRNYDGKFRGPVALRQALAQSLNLPSVKLLYLAGIEDSIRTAREAGISTLDDPNRYGLTLVLGGAEVKLAEMVSAFGVFAQEGILHPSTPVLRIENPRGVVLEELKEISLPALDTEIARTINDMLSDNEARVPVFNPRSSLYFPSRPVAAKTGTTQDFRDAWVLGYTPSVVTGVWVGNSDNRPMNQTAGASIMVAGPIFHKFMEEVFSRTPPEFFNPPAERTAQNPALRGVYQEGPYIKIDKISGKLATQHTPPELAEERGYGAIKTILAFIRPEEPLGSPPENPAKDPQYQNWQAGIERWLGYNSFPRESPPREFDDLHLPAKSPKIRILAPSSAAVPGIQNFQVEVRSAFPLREVSLFLNGELSESKLAPFGSEIVAFSLREALASGPYRVKIAAYDAVGNKSELEQEITVP